jgi:hypothetical protein
VLDPARLERRLFNPRPARAPNVYPLDPLIANTFLTTSQTGSPGVVFILSNTPETSSLIFRSFTVKVFPEANVRIGRKVSERPIAVIEIVDPTKVRICSYLISEMASALERKPSALSTSHQVLQHIESWRESLETVHDLTPEEAIGLWGELDVLERLGASDLVVDRWHGPEAATFDFAGNRVTLEVKTSLKGHEHDFWAEQLVPPGKSELYVGSLHITTDHASGDTITDKVSRIASRIRTPEGFYKKLMRLGMDPGKPREERFSLASLRVYDGSVVPLARADSPAVSRVRFHSNLEMVRPLPKTRASTVLRRLAHGP